MPVHLRIEDLGQKTPPRDAIYSGGLITIGRDAANVVQLDDVDHTISRRHAAIRSGMPPELMDLGSRNFTYLNDQRLEPQRGYPLNDGDVIRLASFRIQVQLSEAAAAEAAPLQTQSFETQRALPSAWAGYQPPLQDASREDLAQAVEELKLLNELALAIGASHDTDAIMNEVVRRNLEATGAEQGLITLMLDTAGESGQPMHYTMVRTGKEFDLDQQLEAWMVVHAQPFLLNNPRQHPVFHNVKWKETLRNLMCVPLLVRGKMTGLLTLYNKRGGEFTDADLRLASILAAQSAHIIENARLFEEQKELLRMQQEMQVALDIQTNLMPKEAPVIDGYDVAGRSLAAQVVGGDHFDYIPMQNGRWALCLGDVAGKGLPAALVMANLQATLRAQTLWSDSVKACMEGANQLLYQSTNRRTFVTLFYCVLDPKTHSIRYANAGHNRPIIISADGVRPLPKGGFALAAMRNVQYAEEELTLAPGEALLIFSDGVVEARGSDGTLFDDDRLENFAAQYHGAPAKTLVDAVMDAVQAHAGDEPQADDITILAVRRRE